MIIFLCSLILSLVPAVSLESSNRNISYCSTSSSCYVYFDHTIYNKFVAPGSYASSRITNKDQSGGGYSSAALTWGSCSGELGQEIDRNSATLDSYGEWVQVHTNAAIAGERYIAEGQSNVSSSNKFLANVY